MRTWANHVTCPYIKVVQGQAGAIGSRTEYMAAEAVPIENVYLLKKYQRLIEGQIVYLQGDACCRYHFPFSRPVQRVVWVVGWGWDQDNLILITGRMLRP